MFVILLLSSLMLMNVIFALIYLFYKGINGMQNFQQSSYNSGRYFKYIKENYKYTLGINELLVLIIVIIFGDYLLIQLLLTLIIFYYNLQFFQLAKKRYQSKLPLKMTKRVKRLLITSLILLGVMIYLISSFFILRKLYLGFIIAIVSGTYLINFIILIAGIINLPIEKVIQNNFKNQAKKKLKIHTQLFIVGITGSYGKTSIKNILGDMLEENEITLRTPSSFNTPMGLTLTINNELNIFHQNFLAEMGAYYPGEIKELAELVNPQVGIVSSVGPQHLETFKTIENITETKMELIENLPIDGLGVLNFDNQYIRQYQCKNQVEIKWYSVVSEQADIFAKGIKYLHDGMEFEFVYQNKEYLVRTKLLGKHNVGNILAAILIMDFKGISMEKIIESIDAIEPISNRLELKIINSNLTIIDDSFNANIEGVKEALNILGKMKAKRKVLITPGIIDGGKQNDDLNINYGQAITSDVTDIVIIGKYNQRPLTNGISEDLRSRIKLYDNFIEGYNYAVQIPEEKIILIANDLPDKYNT